MGWLVQVRKNQILTNTVVFTSQQSMAGKVRPLREQRIRLLRTQASAKKKKERDRIRTLDVKYSNFR
jgi:hypothetical protein